MASQYIALNIRDNALDVPSVNERWLSMETMLRTASLSGGKEINFNSASMNVAELKLKVAKVRQSSNRESAVSSERLVQKVIVKSDKAQDVVAGE